MRKGLIGIMVLVCVALISGTALAAQTKWSVKVEGTVEWTIINQDGLMPGVDGTGPAFVIPELTVTAGPWEAGSGADALTEGYIKYTADMGSITLNNEVSYDIFGLEADITAAQGITLATEVAPLSIDAVYTAGKEYGIGLGYAAGDVTTLGVAYNSTAAWGAQLVTSISALGVTLTTGMNAANASAYGIALEAGKLSLGYDVSFVPVAKLSAALTGLPLTENTLLTIEAVNQDIAAGDYEAGTTITATGVTSLADAIDLTTVIASKPAAGFEYSAKIGVEF